MTFTYTCTTGAGAVPLLNRADSLLQRTARCAAARVSLTITGSEQQGRGTQKFPVEHAAERHLLLALGGLPGGQSPQPLPQDGVY